ncbi:MAG: ribonuclease III [Bacteroidota bacterium]
MNFISNIFESRSEKNGIFYNKIVEILGFKPKNISIYRKAFIHSSAQKKDVLGNDVNYERLEFLGDSVLNTVISDYLYSEAPSENEGYLTKMRSKIVSRKNLNAIGEELGLLDILESKVKPEFTGKNVYGNLFESLIGAIYIDKGFKKSAAYIHKNVIKKNVDLNKLEKHIASYKSLIIEWCQKNKYSVEFVEKPDDGCDTEKHFSIHLKIDDKTIGRARETSKKRAEEKAAKRAYFALQDKIQP